MNLFNEQHFLYGIMLVTSLFLAVGLLIYTAPYRKRGRLSDKLFFTLEILCLLGLFGDSFGLVILYALDTGNQALAMLCTQLMGLMDIPHELFDGVLVLYIFYLKYKDIDRLKKIIPFVAVFAVIIIGYQNILMSILTGLTPPVIPPLWLSDIVYWIDGIYHFAGFLMILLMSRRLTAYYLLAIVTSLLMNRLSGSGWGETGSMMNAQLLVFFHLYIMNHSFIGEDENVPVRI